MPRASKSKVKNDPEYKAASQSGSGELGRWSYEEKLAVVREVIAANIGKVDFKEIHHKIYVEGNQDHAFPARSVKQVRDQYNQQMAKQLMSKGSI